jgi:hypothetical protein
MVSQQQLYRSNNILMFLRTDVIGLLARMTPENIPDHILVVQLVLVTELGVVSFALVEEGLQLWDVVCGLFSSKSCPPAFRSIRGQSQQFRIKIALSNF